MISLVVAVILPLSRYQPDSPRVYFRILPHFFGPSVTSGASRKTWRVSYGFSSDLQPKPDSRQLEIHHFSRRLFTAHVLHPTAHAVGFSTGIRSHLPAALDRYLVTTNFHHMEITTKWAPGRTAADYLNVSERTLFRWRAAGLLKPGVHFRRKFPAANSSLIYDLELCERAMNEACARDFLTLERVVEVT